MATKNKSNSKSNSKGSKVFFEKMCQNHNILKKKGGGSEVTIFRV